MSRIAIALLLLMLGGAALIAFANYRWQAGTRQLRAALAAARIPVKPRLVDFGELAGLPAPVQRYLRIALTDGMPMVASVTLAQSGSMQLGENASPWKAFTADQYVVTARPGFDWNARIGVLPGVTARVHDAYVAGEGALRAALLGLFTMADLHGSGDLAKGELMRFLAEAAWYPTALLPSQGVRWEAVDAHRARATLADGATVVSLLFRFNDAGMIDTVLAEARGRMVGRQVVQTPWQGRFWNYQDRGGMRVPLSGEVAWLLPQGPRPYWRGDITAIAYGPASQ